MGVFVHGADEVNGMQIVVFGRRIDGQAGALWFWVPLPFIIAQLLSTMIALSMNSVISVRLDDQQLSRSLLSIVMSLIFSRITLPV